LSYNPLTVS